MENLEVEESVVRQRIRHFGAAYIYDRVHAGMSWIALSAIEDNVSGYEILDPEHPTLVFVHAPPGEVFGGYFSSSAVSAASGLDLTPPTAPRSQQRTRPRISVPLRAKPRTPAAPETAPKPEPAEGPNTLVESWLELGWLALTEGVDASAFASRVEAKLDEGSSAPEVFDLLLAMPEVDDLYVSEGDATRFLEMW